MKKKWGTAMSVSLTICLVLAMRSLGWPEEVRIGAGAAATENIFNRIKEPMEKSIGLKLVLISNGPVDAWKDLDKGVVEAAAGGLSVSDWTALMEKGGYRIANVADYQSREIGRDTVRLLVNKGVSIGKLGKEQLKGIFTGDITNWKQVGGPDLPIVVVLGKQIPGTQKFFQDKIMDGAPYIQSAMEATTAADVKTKIVATPGGAGLGPASAVDITVNEVDLPVAGRPITLITRGAPSPAIMKMLNFLNGEGRNYVFK